MRARRGVLPRAIALLACAALALAGCGESEPSRLVLGATHTLEDSGLLDELTRAYAAERDHPPLSVVVAASGEILMMARRGDVDVVLAHSPDAEIAFMRDGAGASRQPVMRSEFLLLGPPGNPAGVDVSAGPAAALAVIAARGEPFVSRGDDSGTHARERALWQRANVSPSWPGYLEAGSGMADALRVASQRGAYILAERATFETMRDDLDLDIVIDGGESLANPYSVIVVAGARNAIGARHFADWIRSGTAQRIIAGYGRSATRRRLFMPYATDSTES